MPPCSATTTLTTLWKTCSALRDRAQYAMLSANTKFKEGKAYAGEKEYPFGDYITKEAAGLKFGIFGVTDDQSAATTLYSNTYDIEWDDDLTTAKTLVSRLKNEESWRCRHRAVPCAQQEHALITENPAVDISIGGGNDIAGRRPSSTARSTSSTPASMAKP